MVSPPARFALFHNTTQGEESEIAYLIDPIDETDVALLAFDEEGKAVPVPESPPGICNASMKQSGALSSTNMSRYQRRAGRYGRRSIFSSRITSTRRLAAIWEVIHLLSRE
jgi:hypothetical protein